MKAVIMDYFIERNQSLQYHFTYTIVNNYTQHILQRGKHQSK